MRRILIACTLFATPALAEEGKDWTISLSGGINGIEGQPDQHIASLSVSRAFGDSYVRGSVTRIEGGDFGGLTGALPAKTTQFTLAGGMSFDALSIDVYALAGSRSFDAESFRARNGIMLTLDTSGNVYGAGATVTYDVPVGTSWFLSPFASIDYNRIDTARVIDPPGLPPIVREQREDGVTGVGGATLSRMFGPESVSSVGGYAAFVTTSNTAAVNRAGSASTGSQLLSVFDAAGGNDSWFEYGATASFALSKRMRLDASVVRTAGLTADESTSGTLGLRFNF